MGNPWLQRRLFACPECETHYTHDRAYAHNLFTCTQRPLTPRQRIEQFLRSGRVYEPATEKAR